MARYLFFVSRSYSFAILRPLQRVIRETGGEAAWFLSDLDPGYLHSGEKRLESVAEVKEFQPEAVFVPGNVVPDFFPGIKVQLFHGFGIEKKGHFRIRGFFDLYCTHGPLTTGPFRKLAARHGHFHVEETGWPKVDPLFRPEMANRWREEHRVDGPMILYAPTFSPSLTSAHALLEQIGRMSASGPWRWVIKFHPKMDPRWIRSFERLRGPNLVISHEPDILPLLKAADVLLTDTSSVVAEFLLLGKPVVTFRTSAPGPHVLDIRQESELEGALARALERPADLLRRGREYADTMHPYRDGRSSERVLQAVREFKAHHAQGLRRKPMNLLRRLKIRRQIGYYRLR